MSCSLTLPISQAAFSPSRLLLIPSDGSPSSTLPLKSPFRSTISRFFTPTRSSSSNNPFPLFKRKWPAKIALPKIDTALGFALAGSDCPNEVEMDDIRCSIYSKRGRKRMEMEDRFTVNLDVNNNPLMAFFGIFNGHGGTKAAEFASKNMGKHIVEEVMRGDEYNLEVAVTKGFLKNDSEFLKKEVASGTCSVTAFVRAGNLVVSNAGDCRAVLSVSRSAEALTSDHRPSREDGRERIENLGGYVDFCRGLWRVQGCLAVSRGIGDSHMRPWVITNPETRILAIKPEFEFLILASDGLWDKVSNQEAVDMARPLCLDAHNPSPLSACKKLVDLSASRGSVDDTSVMIIQMKHFVCRNNSS